MRTIKFRGYGIHQERWLYGSVLLDGGEAWITETKQGLFVDMNKSSINLDSVIQETVGQFTGLTDNNGKEIYEGDVLKTIFPVVEKNVVVFYGDSSFNYRSVDKKHGDPFDDNEWGTNGDYWVVIGNIHDNPELLK